MQVKIFLRDIDVKVVDAWRVAFKGNQDAVSISCGDIFDIEADAIVSPANSFGFMNGGIDLAYTRRFGDGLSENLRKLINDKHYGELPVGCAEVVPTADVKIKYLISAPTMRLPEDVSKTINAYLAFRAALIAVCKFNESRDDKIKSILCPGLATLTGRMSPTDSAVQMREAYASILNFNTLKI